jgi:hypothetical protein
VGMTYARTRPAVNCCPSRPVLRRAARGGVGAVAQMEERFHGMEEVRSSSLRSSTLVSPGAMAQLVARLVRNEKAGSSSLPSSTGNWLTNGMWRSLVARIVRGDEARGSNPRIPT